MDGLGFDDAMTDVFEPEELILASDVATLSAHLQNKVRALTAGKGINLLTFPLTPPPPPSPHCFSWSMSPQATTHWYSSSRTLTAVRWMFTFLTREKTC